MSQAERNINNVSLDGVKAVLYLNTFLPHQWNLRLKTEERKKDNFIARCDPEPRPPSSKETDQFTLSPYILMALTASWLSLSLYMLAARLLYFCWASVVWQLCDLKNVPARAFPAEVMIKQTSLLQKYIQALRQKCTTPMIDSFCVRKAPTPRRTFPGMEAQIQYRCLEPAKGEVRNSLNRADVATRRKYFITLKLSTNESAVM